MNENYPVATRDYLDQQDVSPLHGTALQACAILSLVLVPMKYDPDVNENYRVQKKDLENAGIPIG
jgi:hypothetical protein